MLLAAQKDVNRVLDAEVRKLMAQLEDLNRRYVTQVRALIVLGFCSVAHVRVQGYVSRCWRSCTTSTGATPPRCERRVRRLRWTCG